MLFIIIICKIENIASHHIHAQNSRNYVYIVSSNVLLQYYHYYYYYIGKEIRYLSDSQQFSILFLYRWIDRYTYIYKLHIILSFSYFTKTIETTTKKIGDIIWCLLPLEGYKQQYNNINKLRNKVNGKYSKTKERGGLYQGEIHERRHIYDCFQYLYTGSTVLHDIDAFFLD